MTLKNHRTDCRDERDAREAEPYSEPAPSGVLVFHRGAKLLFWGVKSAAGAVLACSGLQHGITDRDASKQFSLRSMDTVSAAILPVNLE